MRASTFVLPVAVAFVLVAATPSSADAPKGQPKPTATVSPTPVLLMPCLTSTPNDTVTLSAGSTSATAKQLNVTATPGSSGSSSGSKCTNYIAEINVSSSSDPPAGYSKSFTIKSTLDGSFLTKELCAVGKSTVTIYKKSQGAAAFTLVSSSDLTATWNMAKNPAKCEYNDYSVNGSVPSSSTDIYRLVYTQPAYGTVTSTITRTKK